jgi:hypothetical protein
MRELGEGDIALLMFDTEIKVANNDADKARWDKFIEIALEKDQITPADVAMLDMIEDQTYRSFLLAQAIKEKKASDMEISKANSQSNIAQAKAAADAKGQHDMQLEQVQHQNVMQKQQAELDAKTTMKNMEGTATLEGKIIDAVLSNPEATVEAIPSFIWEKLHITDESTKSFLLQSMQKAAQQQQQMAMAQRQQAQPNHQQQGVQQAA